MPCIGWNQSAVCNQEASLYGKEVAIDIGVMIKAGINGMERGMELGMESWNQAIEYLFVLISTNKILNCLVP